MSRIALLRAGIVAIIIALGITGVVTVMRSQHDAGITVTAEFDNTIGLYQGNAVSILGIQVGKVAAIEPHGRYVKVTLDIDPGVDLPADVHAVTISTSILTDRHIELTPPYRTGAKLRSGDTLGLNRTRTPVEFDRTLQMVDKLARSLRGDGKGQGPVADLVNLGSAATSDNGQLIKTTLEQLSQALRLGADNGARSKGNIQAIANNLASLTDAAAANDQTIRELGGNIAALSDIIADEHLGTGTTGTKLNQVLQQAAELLERNRDVLKDTASDTQTITKSVSDSRRDLAEFFDVAPLAADNVYNAIDPNAGTLRVHGLIDKVFFNDQMAKEICNLVGDKQLGCATGTLKDYGPDFGLTGMLRLMAGTHP